MHRSLSQTELDAVKIALQKHSIAYDSSMTVIKKPMVELAEANKDNIRYLIDLRAQLVVNTYSIARRPATC